MPFRDFDAFGEIDCSDYARWRKYAPMLGTIDLGLGLMAVAATGVLVVRVVLAASAMDQTISALAHKNASFSAQIAAQGAIIVDREGRIAVQQRLLRVAGEKLNSAIVEMPPIETAEAP